MNNTPHTPTPWSVTPIQPGDKWIEIPEIAARIDYDDVNHDEQRANAELTVRAVNAFDDLITHLKECRDELPSDSQARIKTVVLLHRIENERVC